MTEFFAQPDDMGELRASELHSSLGERLGAQAGEAFMGGSRTLFRLGQYSMAGGAMLPGTSIEDQWHPDVAAAGEAYRAGIPDVAITDAKARVKQEGLDGRFTLPDQPSIKAPVLDLMIAHAHERRSYEAAVSRGPQGFMYDALGMATEIGAGIVDPVNIAAFSIPVVGEARLGMLMARAGEGFAARAGVRAGVGAAQGAVGTTALQPADWWLHTKDGVDYTMADALHSIVLGAGMGAAFHAGIGAFKDARARRRGEPLEGVQPTPENRPAAEPGRLPVSEPLSAEEVPGISGSERTPAGEPEFAPLPAPEDLPPEHPAFVLADLPPRAREDVTRAAVADVINGNAVRGAELLHEAAKDSPRIAESLQGAEPTVVEGPKAARGPRARDPETWSLLEYIASRGGIRADEPLIGDLRGSIGTSNKFVPGFGHLIRQPQELSTAAKLSGRRAPMTLDQAREAAIEAGYLRDNGADAGRESTTDINTLLGAMDQEMRGNRVYREGREPVQRFDAAENRAYIEREAHGALRDDGIDLQRVPDKTMARVVEIMEREGERDPLQAYERAVMEETYYGAETGQHERIADDIPGWDVPDEPGAASRAGAEAARGGERGAGAAARQPGGGDRAAPQADWQRLAELKRAGDEDLAAASHEAAKTPEPESIEPAKAPTAAEKAAAEADKMLEDIRASLSDEERTLFDERLAELGADREQREQIIRDGAACLMAAVA